MGVTYSQFFPPAPTLTEQNLANQSGKVFIVTGGTAGVGYELCKILYGAGGTVYLAGRSKTNADKAIAAIRNTPSKTPGKIEFLQVDLSDLRTIKPAVEAFKKAESRLDVLINNAGVSNPPKGSTSAQGYELQMGTNCLGHYLLTQLLLPLLTSTASHSPAASTRVIWTSSIAVDLGAPQGGGVNVIDLGDQLDLHPQTNYTISKTGNWYLAQALADQAGKDGVLSVTQNPGNLRSQLTRHFSALVPILVSPLLHHARFGAYTELWAAVSEELGMGDGGLYILPWGRRHPAPRADLLEALKSREEGGTGRAAEFAQWCEEQTRVFR